MGSDKSPKQEKTEAVPAELLQKAFAGDTDAAMETVIRRLEADLQATKERLRLTIEQNEPSVEELKASNEELQAINEELTTVNHELKEKIDEVSRAHSDLQNLMRSTDIGTIFLDRDLRIKRFTMTVQHIFNIIPGDVGRPIEHITHRLDYKTLTEDAHEVMQTLQIIEREVRNEDDRWFIARFVPYRTADDRIDGVLLTFLDFTERRQAQFLERQTRIFNTTLSSITDFVYILDCDGRFVYSNRPLLDLLGITLEEIVGKNFFDLNYPEDLAARLQRQIQQVCETGETIRDETPFTSPTGAEGFYEYIFSPIFVADGTVESVAGSTRDIIEHKQSEEKINQLGGRNREILESISDGFFALDRDWRFTYVNSQTELILDKKSSDLIGNVLWDVYNLAGSEFEKAYHRTANEGVVSTFTAYFPDHDRWYEVNAYPASNGITVFFKNATERKRREANLVFLTDIAVDFSRQSSADEIMQAVGEKIGVFLNISNCLFAEIDETADKVVVESAWQTAGTPNLVGVYRLSEFVSEEFQQAARGGETIVVSDTQIDSRTDAAAYSAYNVRSFITVPFKRGGEWKFLLTVNDSAARNWREDEIELVREITSRIFPRIERARAEEKLRESEEKYRSLFNSIDEGFCTVEIIFDNQEKPVDYRFLEYNPVFEQLTGLADATGKTALELVPTLEDFWFETYGKVALTGEAVRFEDHSEPMNRWFDVHASRIGDETSRKVAIVFTNITERKQMEQALRESEEKFRNLANSISQLAWMTDAEGYIFWYNERWFEYTGTTLEEMQGWGWQTVHHPNEIERVVKKFKRHIASGEEWEDTFLLRSKTGEYRWFLSRALPIRDETGKIVRWFGTNTDIEDVRRAEEKLKEADRRKDEFLATLAHELRNPLAPIRSGLEIIRRATSDKPARMEALDIIERQTNQMVHLVDDLLDISRITQGKIKLRKTRFELKSAVDMALESSRDMLEMTGHKLIVALPDEPVYLDADFTRISQILLNILNNSVKYTQPGGEIRLTAEKRDGEAVISFLDSGIGIPPEMMPHIFEMFSQIENASEQAHGGLGIGLSVVKRLVEMHGGTITASSAGKGKGSEFVVHLPLAAEQSAKTEDKLPSAADIAQYALLKTAENRESGKVGENQILVVDDNADAAQMLEVLLKLNGHEVRIAFDGETGLAVNEEFQPEAALLDIGLPGISGYETARRIREKNPDILLIAVSGWGAENDRLRSSEAGFNYHLVKPVELGDVEKLLSEPAEK